MVKLINLFRKLVWRRSTEPASEKLSVFATIATCKKFLVEQSLGAPCLLCRSRNVVLSYSTLRNPTICVENADRDDVLLANYVLHCAENMWHPLSLAATVVIEQPLERRKAEKLVRRLGRYSRHLLEAIEKLPDELPPLIVVRDGEVSQSMSALLECPMRYVLLVSKYGVVEGRAKYFVFFVGRRL